MRHTRPGATHARHRVCHGGRWLRQRQLLWPLRRSRRTSPHPRVSAARFCSLGMPGQHPKTSTEAAGQVVAGIVVSWPSPARPAEEEATNQARHLCHFSHPWLLISTQPGKRASTAAPDHRAAAAGSSSSGPRRFCRYLPTYKLTCRRAHRAAAVEGRECRKWAREASVAGNSFVLLGSSSADQISDRAHPARARLGCRDSRTSSQNAWRASGSLHW